MLPQLLKRGFFPAFIYLFDLFECYPLAFSINLSAFSQLGSGKFKEESYLHCFFNHR